MNEVENKAIKYQIDFEKYKNSEANKILSLLDKSNKEISQYIKQTTDIATKKRYVEVARKLRDVSKTLRENIDKNTDIEGIIEYELRKQKSLLNTLKPFINTKKTPVNFLYPTVEQIKTAALFTPYDKTSTYSSYLDSIESGLFNIWDANVRTGYMTGIPTKEIVDNVVGKVSHLTKLKQPGVINSFYNSVYANTRTVLQSFASVTRNKIYEENEQYFGDDEGNKYEYLATLDSRTCIVCGECDGKLYKSLKDCPAIPQHRGCRCIIVPYFGIEGEKRASKDGYVKKISFNEWITHQPENVQLEVLGKTRYDLLKENPKNIYSFVVNGTVVPVKSLTKPKYTDITETEYDKYVSSCMKTITDEEKKQIDAHLVDKRMRGYTRTANSRFINRIVREYGIDELDDEDKKTYYALQDGIAKNKLQKDSVLYRKVNIDFIDKNFNIKSKHGLSDFYYDVNNNTDVVNQILQLKGKTFTEKQFISCSTDLQKNFFRGMPVTIEYHLPKGTNVFFPDNKPESECILGVGNTFRIINSILRVDGIYLICELK